MSKDLGYTRRGALLGLGAAAGLAACGSDDSDPVDAPAQSNDAAAGGQKSPGAQAGAPLGAASEVPVGGGKIYRKEKVVVSQPTAGDFRAFSAVCTHSGCLLSAVQPEGFQCRCHGSLFSKTDGSVVSGVAETPLPEKRVTVQD
ncbi:MAG: Rieske (2Fe-2S) protein, partial [Angustibacter sp.]